MYMDDTYRKTLLPLVRIKEKTNFIYIYIDIVVPR